jgi:hypothetical protein
MSNSAFLVRGLGERKKEYYNLFYSMGNSEPIKEKTIVSPPQ